MRIEAIDLIAIRIPLMGNFRISRGRFSVRNMLLVRVHSEGAFGWGEAGADRLPLYTYETVETCRHMIRDFLAPELFAADLPTPGTALAAGELLGRWHWHPMARAGIEEAVWDLEARRAGVPVHRLYAGDRPVRDRVEVGISLGIEEDFGRLAALIESALEQGYRRIKLKIEPGNDIEAVRQVRARFGDIPVMVDANCGYGVNEIDRLLPLDDFGLVMIEQPFEYEELEAHARLQARIDTPICLDESAKSPAITERALAMDAARIINIKCARLGGRGRGLEVHDLCAERNVPVWCGGMLEAGIGRLHNIAIASLPNFQHVNDLSASRRYWERDIIEPEVELLDDGCVAVPQSPGIGYDVREDALLEYEIDRVTLRP